MLVYGPGKSRALLKRAMMSLTFPQSVSVLSTSVVVDGSATDSLFRIFSF